MADYTLSARITGDDSSFKKAIQSCQASLDNLKSKFESVSGKLSSLSSSFAPVSNVVKNIGVSAVKTFADFQSQMSKVSAISGATGKDFEKLNAKAKEMGASTKFSATEAGQAMEYMAMAGWKTESMMDGIEGIMNLAAASGESLALTSDIVTDALTAFGLSASDSGHFADVLAQASSNANTNVAMLGESFKYVAPVAGAMKYSVEDVSLALGLMANASIKGSMAGTSLKTAIANMAKPTKKMASAMEQYGISLTNSDGTAKTFAQVIDNLRSSLGGLSETQQTAVASTIFGKEAMAGMLAIVNASPSDYEKLTSAINDADGSAQRMATTMQENLSGAVTIMKSTLEGVAIVIGETLEPYVSKVVAVITELANKFLKLNPTIQKTIIAVGTIVGVIAPALLIASKLISFLGFLTGGLSGLGSALAFVISPVGLLVAGLIGLSVWFVQLMKSNEEFRNKVTSVFGKIKNIAFDTYNILKTVVFDTVGKIKTKFQEILQSDVFQTLKNSAVSHFGIIEKIATTIFSSIKNTFNSIVTVIQSVFETAKGIVIGFVGSLTDNFETAGGSIGELGNAISSVSIFFNPLMAILKNFAPQIVSLIKQISDPLKSVFSTIGSTMGEVLAEIIPLIQKVTSTISNALNTVIPVISQLITTLLPMITQAIADLMPVVSTVITTVIRLITQMLPFITQIIDTVLPLISEIIRQIVPVISGIISTIKWCVSGNHTRDSRFTDRYYADCCYRHRQYFAGSRRIVTCYC
ncbi:MAG: phage tail tape measure protein [Clostridia bacterium]|nr:phage tail tape measure protein [Clostridia bacterium]